MENKKPVVEFVEDSFDLTYMIKIILNGVSKEKKCVVIDRSVVKLSNPSLNEVEGVFIPTNKEDIADVELKPSFLVVNKKHRTYPDIVNLAKRVKSEGFIFYVDEEVVKLFSTVCKDKISK